MRVAIIFGISEYLNFSSLEACKNDSDIVRKIFESLDKFEDICFLSGNIKAFEAKQKITEFVNKHKEDSIEELVFYYTGHGARYDDDFFYVFSDFNEKRKEVTALRNSELDGLIRNLSPDLTVKIIDACYSGSTYVKSDDDIKPTLEKSASENRLNNLYFFHSSSSEETSLANDTFSFFTFSLCKSIVELDGSIRYRDMMAFVADDMSQSGYPKPTFVVQADNTEVFGDVDDDLRERVGRLLKISDFDQNTLKEDGGDCVSGESSLIKLIERKSTEEFCSKEDASTSISLIKEEIDVSKWPSEILNIFEIEIKEIENAFTIPNGVEIGRWISNDSSEDWFAYPTYDTETYFGEEYKRLPKKPGSAVDLLGGSLRRFGLGGDYEYKLEKVEKTRKFIDGFEYAAESPFRGLQIVFEPKFSAVENYSMTIVLLFSRRSLLFFVARENLPYESWDRVRRAKCFSWKTKELLLKNDSAIRDYANELISSMSTFIIDDISEKLDK